MVMMVMTKMMMPVAITSRVNVIVKHIMQYYAKMNNTIRYYYMKCVMSDRRMLLLFFSMKACHYHDENLVNADIDWRRISATRGNVCHMSGERRRREREKKNDL